jgi:inhibitor of cysteine peptidase
MLQVNDSSNGKQIDLPIGETLEVSLPENKTTGFQWVPGSSAKGVLSLVSDELEPGRKIGEPGIHRWLFRAERAGSDRIELTYRRQWEEKEKPQRTFALGIRVSK